MESRTRAAATTPATRRSTLQHQRQDEHEDGDVIQTEKPRSDASNVVEPAAVGNNVPTPPIGFPLSTDQQFLASLMETITRAQAEANRALITALLSPPRRDQHSGASPPSAPSPPASGAFPPFVNGGSKSSSLLAGNFTKCSARFDGSSNDAEVLEAFLDSVEVFKECASVSDEHALRGLPMLLTGDAAVWWRGVRAGASSWTEAKLRLRSMYGAPRPAYKVFREVFAREQSAAEPSERFMSEKRALLARLPYRLAEEVQVDIAYGLLERRIRKRVPRESIEDMDHLLERVRMAEDSLKETSSGEVKPQQTDIKIWSFKEIAYQAELNRHEDLDSAEVAYLLCDEDPYTRKRSIEELRNMIYERGECHPPRSDDSFLLRFLRARKSIPARAHRLLVRYCTFRDQNPHLWRDVDWFSLTRLGNIFEGVLYDRPDVGRLIICRLGKWDPSEIPVEDLIRGCLLLLEVGIMQPKLQILGGTAILDCEGLTMRHMRQLSPTIAVHAMNVMGYAFPIHQRGIHIVNCSRFFETLFPLFRRFAPADDLWKKVQFHGYDFTSLHRFIDPECLPRRYGGFQDETSLAMWLTKIRGYKNKEFDEDMRTLGYYAD